MRTIQVSIKIGLNVMAAYFVVTLFKKKKYGKLWGIVIYNNSVLFFNFCLAVIGVGFVNYSAGEGKTFGGTGFFYAGNELGVALLLGVCSIIVLNKKNNVVAFALLYGLFGGLAIMSKAAIFGVVIVIAAHFYFVNKKFFFTIVAVFFVFASAAAPYIYSYFELAINRWVYFIERSGLSTFILGGEKRLYYSSLVMSNIESNFLYFVFGAGWTGYPENNLFDLMDSFGLFGIVIFSIWVWVLMRGLRVRDFASEHPSFKTVSVIAFLVLIISVVAGHSIQSSLVLPFLGFVASKAWQKDNF